MIMRSGLSSSSLLLLCLSLSTSVQLSVAFQSVVIVPSSKGLEKTTSETKTTSSSSLFVANRRLNNDDRSKTQKNPWDNFKRVVYSTVDGVNGIGKFIQGENNNDDGKNNGYPSRVSGGYADFEDSFRQTTLRSKQQQQQQQGLSPAMRLMGEYQARTATGATTAASAGVSSSYSAPVTTAKGPRKSGFQSFKENLYAVADVTSQLIGVATKNVNNNDDETLSSDMTREEPSVPYKRSLAQDYNNVDLVSQNPVKRFQAQMEIREREAQKRAIERNERIRAKKEDLYKIVDAFQATVDSIPERIDQTEQAVKDVTRFLKTVPTRVDRAVEDARALPERVQSTADQTKRTVEDSIETTKQIVQDVRDIPNRVGQTIEGTKKVVTQTKDTVSDAVTKVKVLVGVEKPKPKPPVVPPPKDPTVSELALDVAGRVAGATGKVAWWATKGTVGLAWNGARTMVYNRLDKDGTTSGSNRRRSPTKIKTKTTKRATTTTTKTKSSTGPASKKAAAAAGGGNNDQSVTDTQSVEDEVEEALRFAEDLLKKYEEDDGSKK